MEEYKVYGFLQKQISLKGNITFICKYYILNIFNMTFLEKSDANDKDYTQLFGYKQLSHISTFFTHDESKNFIFPMAFKLTLCDCTNLDQESMFIFNCEGFKNYKLWINGFNEFFKKKRAKSLGIYQQIKQNNKFDKNSLIKKLPSENIEEKMMIENTKAIVLENNKNTKEANKKKRLITLTNTYYIKCFLDSFSMSMIGDIKQAPMFCYNKNKNLGIGGNSSYNNLTNLYAKSFLNQSKFNNNGLLFNESNQENKLKELFKRFDLYQKMLINKNPLLLNYFNTNITNIYNNKHNNYCQGNMQAKEYKEPNEEFTHSFKLPYKRRSLSFDKLKVKIVITGKIISESYSQEYSISNLLNSYLKTKIDTYLPIERINFNKDFKTFHLFIKRLKITEEFMRNKFVLFLSKFLVNLKFKYKAYKDKEALKEIEIKTKNEWDAEIRNWKNDIGLSAVNKDYLLKHRQLLGKNYTQKLGKASHTNKREDVLTKLKQEINKEFSIENIEKQLRTKQIKHMPLLNIKEEKISKDGKHNINAIINKRNKINNDDQNENQENQTNIRLLEEGRNFTMEFRVKENNKSTRQNIIDYTLSNNANEDNIININKEVKAYKAYMFTKHYNELTKQIDEINFFDEKLGNNKEYEYKEIDTDINNILDENIDHFDPHFKRKIKYLNYNYDTASNNILQSQNYQTKPRVKEYIIKEEVYQVNINNLEEKNLHYNNNSKLKHIEITDNKEIENNSNSLFKINNLSPVIKTKSVDYNIKKKENVNNNKDIKPINLNGRKSKELLINNNNILYEDYSKDNVSEAEIVNVFNIANEEKNNKVKRITKETLLREVNKKYIKNNIKENLDSEDENSMSFSFNNSDIEMPNILKKNKINFEKKLWKVSNNDDVDKKIKAQRVNSPLFGNISIIAQKYSKKDTVDVVTYSNIKNN